VTVLRGAVDVGICYVTMRFFFAHALVLPVTVLTAVVCSARTFVRFRIVLDPAAGDVAITTDSGPDMSSSLGSSALRKFFGSAS